MQEELDLNSATQNAAASPGDDVADIEQHVPDLRALIPPGASDEEVAEILARTSNEEYNPFHKVQIPSLGKYYGWPTGYVEVRAMDQEADKVLATEQLVKSGQAIDMILSKFVRLPGGMDVLDLINGDRVYLLYYLRGHSHGPKYEFIATCSECNHSGPYVYDLVQLQETVVWYNPDLGPEPFKIVLPIFSKVIGREAYVQIRWPRGRDTQELVASMRLKNKIQAGTAVASNRRNRRKQAVKQSVDNPKALNDAVTDNLESLIVSFMGNTDRMVIKQNVEKMHQTDTATIRKWINDNIPGPDTSIELKCSSCEATMSIPLPITESFFRSTQ